VQRWQWNGFRDRRKSAHPEPANKLSEAERERIVEILNSPEYRDLSPAQIVPRLADQEIYLASESTLYRILTDMKMNRHRESSRPAKHTRPPTHIATGPNQVWSWDIAYLPLQIRGLFLYLYMVMDIYSRKIIAWQIHDREAAELGADLVTEACFLEGVQRWQVVLHSDNGSPMKGATMLAKLQDLGVIPSFSRPSVSDDNPYSESLFRTLKYRPQYPEHRFADLDDARDWVERFVNWYNNEHFHSGIRFVTPADRHNRKDRLILAGRHQVYQAARRRHPERWSGKTRNWEPIEEVALNKTNKCKNPDDVVRQTISDVISSLNQSGGRVPLTVADSLTSMKELICQGCDQREHPKGLGLD
jgi:putative transposase